MLRSLALSVSLLAVAHPTSADVGVVVTGEAAMQPQLASQLETWLREHGHNLISAPLPPEAINTLIDCFVIEDEGCARKVIEKRAKSTSVVFARIDVQPTSSRIERTVTLTAYWIDKTKDAVAERRFCERCTERTLKSTADELMAALAGAGQADVGRLKLTSRPSGARVVIDGRPLGLTPIDQSLAPGDHTIELSLPAHLPATRKVAIYRTEVTNLEVALEGPPGPDRVLPIALIGGGVALLGTGIALVVVDEDVQDTGPQPPTYRNTAPLGYVLAGVGLAAGAAGGYLLSRTFGERASHPVAALAPGGGLVGWAGSF